MSNCKSRISRQFLTEGMFSARNIDKSGLLKPVGIYTKGRGRYAAAAIIDKAASGMCNLRCRYCFYYDVTHNREQENYGLMSLKTLENVVKKALDYAEGTCGFAFQGGEPTLAGLDFYKELIRFADQYNTRKVPISYSIQTNGYCLGEEWASFFAEHNFLVGVSLDGVKATHDALRPLPPKGKTALQKL